MLYALIAVWRGWRGKQGQVVNEHIPYILPWRMDKFILLMDSFLCKAVGEYSLHQTYSQQCSGRNRVRGCLSAPELDAYTKRTTPRPLRSCSPFCRHMHTLWFPAVWRRVMTPSTPRSFEEITFQANQAVLTVMDFPLQSPDLSPPEH